MCGLAGYNVSFEEAQAFSDNRAAKIAQVGWQFNLHRGIDAHGYMVTYDKTMPKPDDDDRHVLWWFKNKGSAENSIRAKALPNGKPVSMALHTRDGTLGSPDIPENNHPVSWDGCYVTHNGTIKNHKDIKKVFTTEDNKDKIPVVDSVVLPMMLSTIEDPFDTEEVQKTLDSIGRNIDGAYTIHAMWHNHPGLSLVAMGKDRPLCFAYNEKRGIFVYASEKDAVAAILDKMGINRKDSDLAIGTMKVGTGLLLHYGRIIGRFKFDTYNAKGTPAGATLERRSPKGEVLLDNSGVKHWTKRGSPLSSTTFQVEDWDNVVTLGTEQVPAWWRSSASQLVKEMLARGQELDVLYMYYPSDAKSPYRDGIFYYGWKGELELIWDDVGDLVDLIDWGQYKKTGALTVWHELPEETDNVARMTDPQWLAWTSTYVDLPKGKLVPKPPQTPKAQGGQVQQFPIGKTTKTTSTGGLTAKDDQTIFTPNLLTPKNRTQLVRSAHNSGFVFVSDFQCTQHKKFASAHEKPWECGIVFKYAKLLLCSISTLDEMEAIYSDVKLFERGYKHHSGDCKWVNADLEVVEIDGNKSSLALVEEECEVVGCKKIREMVEMPAVLAYALNSQTKKEMTLSK